MSFHLFPSPLYEQLDILDLLSELPLPGPELVHLGIILVFILILSNTSLLIRTPPIRHVLPQQAQAALGSISFC